MESGLCRRGGSAGGGGRPLRGLKATRATMPRECPLRDAPLYNISSFRSADQGYRWGERQVAPGSLAPRWPKLSSPRDALRQGAWTSSLAVQTALTATQCGHTGSNGPHWRYFGFSAGGFPRFGRRTWLTAGTVLGLNACAGWRVTPAHGSDDQPEVQTWTVPKNPVNDVEGLEGANYAGNELGNSWETSVASAPRGSCRLV